MARQKREGPPGDAAPAQPITLAELRRLRMQAQCLAPRKPRQALVDVVKALCGVNAQLPSAMALALRARVEGLTLADIESSRLQDRALVRTWCMRGTMHLLATDDLGWLLSAIPAATIQSGWRWLEKRAGLEPQRAKVILDAAYKTLKQNGPLTRPNLMAALAKQYGGQVTSAAAGLVWLNGMLGRVGFGPDQGNKPTYVALDTWLGHEVQITNPPDNAELTRRYLQGYGPAEPRDMASWWGLPLGEVKKAWAPLQNSFTALRVEEQPVWLASTGGEAAPNTRPQPPVVRLLPAFDTYLLGYHARDFAVAPDHAKHIFHGGELAPVVLVDGLAAGTWRYERRGKQMRITVTPFSTLSAEIKRLIAEEAEDIGRFYELLVALSFASGG
jgi:hypothetical protein